MTEFAAPGEQGVHGVRPPDHVAPAARGNAPGGWVNRSRVHIARGETANLQTKKMGMEGGGGEEGERYRSALVRRVIELSHKLAGQFAGTLTGEAGEGGSRSERGWRSRSEWGWEVG